MRPLLVHIPRTAGTSVALTYMIPNSHVPAVVQRAKNPDWDKAFKFTIVRNPWQHALAVFKFDPASPKDFKQWVKDGCPNLWAYDPLDQLAYFTEDGKDLVDFVCRFDHIRSDLRKVCELTGMEHKTLKIESGDSSPREYRSSYDAKSREVIATRHAKLIERFDYEF